MGLARLASLSLSLCLLAQSAPARAQSLADASATLDDLRAALERDSISTDQLQAIVTRARALSARSIDPRSRGEALFYAADAADRAGLFADALALYRASLDASPGGRFGARARARASTLAPNERDAFAGLSEVQRFRAQNSRPTAADYRSLAARAARWPETPARTQARMLSASGLRRSGALEESASVLRALAEDPETSADDRALALHELSSLRLAQGAPSLARDELSRLHAGAAELSLAARMARRATLHRVAWAALCAQWILGALSVAVASRARRWSHIARAWKRPLPLVHIAVLTVGGALLTRSYDHHDASHVWAFGAAVLSIYFAATAASAVSRRRSKHAFVVVRVILAVCAVLAASFLSMHRFDRGMLDGISL